MKTSAYVVSGNLDIPHDVCLGDTFEIAGTARVVQLEEESTVYPDGKNVPEPRATVALEVRKA